ncbi:hypothetical protein [Halarcobacter anaerophilus]|nr:hypothetical protein [Halarcobacter anaerophilus]
MKLKRIREHLEDFFKNDKKEIKDNKEKIDELIEKLLEKKSL